MRARRKKRGGVWLTLLPLYLFTLVFVAGPLVYMLVLSFQTRAEVWGVIHEFTTDNYQNILQPVYLNTFLESFRLAIVSTLLICAIGYPFGYFMAKLSPVWKGRVMMLLMIPFWTSSLIRLYGWIIIFRANGTLDKLLMGLGLTDSPLKLLYTYPAVVVGMVYALLAVYDPCGVFQRRKAGLEPCGSGARSGRNAAEGLPYRDAAAFRCTVFKASCINA